MKVYWTQESLVNDPNNTSDLTGFLGADSKIMYVNFETRCFETLSTVIVGRSQSLRGGCHAKRKKATTEVRRLFHFYDVHHVDVYLNGKKLSTDEFTAEDGALFWKET